MALPFMALWFCTMSSRAQNELEIQQPVSAIECLTPPAIDRGSPVYPAEQLKIKDSARVLVQLTFESAEAPPAVKILEIKGADHFAADEFAYSVKEFVKRYRLPCLSRDDIPMRVNQEFVFDPGDGRKVFYGEITGKPARQIPMSCFSRPSDGPNYPHDSIAINEGGTLLARVTFDRSSEMPKISILYDADSPHLKKSVETYLEQYRFICPMPDGKPIVTTQSFIFLVDGAARYAFKDVGLKEFLKMVEPLGLIGARFDLTQMSCPFDLSVSVRRPHSENVVGEYGGSDARRKQFIEWVKQLTVKVPQAMKPYLFDKPMKVSVPCLILNL
jgi:hypothetical protein